MVSSHAANQGKPLFSSSGTSPSVRSSPFLLVRPTEIAESEILLRAASQMHRGPAQFLANALMQLRLCEQHMFKDPSYAHALLRRSLACMEDALGSVRATIRMLRCSHEGTMTIATLFWVAIEELRSVSPAEFSVNVATIGPMLPTVEAGLATVGLEALTNAANHAAARRIAVTLFRSRRRITLDVMDDGKGFDYAEVLRRSSDREGVGLVLMREQIQRLGGTLHIERRPAGGTLVRAVVPSFWRPVRLVSEIPHTSQLARSYY